jgi:predicted nucleic-acid-binding Zn-ribbon protein
MEEYRCPRCNETMDEGQVSFSGSTTAGYVSKKQTGMVRRAATIKQARACPHCGYVEMYLDPNELKKNSS